MSKPERYTAEQVATAITQSRGIIATAAESLGCTRQTVEKYINRYSVVKEACREARESTIDFVESKLLKNIDAGDTTAMIFFLKTIGKSRGYTERQEVTGADGGSIKVDATIKSAIEKVYGSSD